MSHRHFAATIAFSLLVSTQLLGTTLHKVKMTDRQPYLSPQVLEVTVGDTVVWENDGPQLAHAVIDAEFRLFSEDIAVGQSWSYIFSRAGIYSYLCQRHFFMRGTVFVRTKDGELTSPPDHPYQRAFKELEVPTPRAVPRMIAVSRFDDTVWFTEGGGDFYGFEDIPAQNKLAQIDSQDRIVEYATPPTEAQGTKLGVDSVVMDHNGNIWFTERVSNRIGYLDKSHTIHEFSLPTKNGEVLGIDVDSTDTIWFAERFGNRIGRITQQGKITELEMPEPDIEPRAVFADSQDHIWYTARAGNEIGYYDKKLGTFHRVRLPTEKARPAGLCEADDGAVYFAEMVANKIGKLVGNQIVEYATPTKFAAPFKCALDQRGNVWFTEVFGNAIGRLDTRTGEIVEFQIPTKDSRPGGIAVDHKGRIWFTEQSGNKIGVFDPSAIPNAGKLENEGGVLHGLRQGADFLNVAVQSRLRDFPIPTPGAGPGGDLVDDTRGWLWFAEVYGNKLAALNSVTGEFREIGIPTPTSMPVGVARTTDGILWVTEFRGNRLAMIDPQRETVHEFTMPRPLSFPAGITVNERDEVWFTQIGTGRIARFDRKSEEFEQFDMPGGAVAPLNIASDGHSALWVTSSNEAGNYLAKFDLRTRKFAVFALPTPACGPAGMLVDGGIVWVAESQGGKLARFDMEKRAWDEFPIPTARSEPVRLAKDSRGRVWIADGGGMGTAGGNALEVFDPVQRSFSVMPMQTHLAKPFGILYIGKGQLWFTQMGANSLSLISLQGEVL